jgi:DNA polymerase III epsilon subunit-like protein
MSFVVIDCETTGLFRDAPADAEGQPRLASLAMITVNPRLEVEAEYHALVRPDGWQMPDDISAINGLTTEMLIAGGVPVRNVLDEYFRSIVIEERTVVGHNVAFDLKQMRGELRRAGMDDLRRQTESICTMHGMRGYVPPKARSLRAMCAQCGHTPDSGVLKSLSDARATLFLLRKMSELGILPEPRT